MRDPTWFDSLLAVILIMWVLFVVFGGLAALGWWLGGLFSTEPGTRTAATTGWDGEARRGRSPGLEVALSQTGTRPPEYIVYDDPDSSMQVLEDDREWHHDRRRSEGHAVCPECGTPLRGPRHG